MSFILEDKNLVNALLRYGLSKTAQQYVGITPQDFTAVRGIIDNLEKQLSSPNFVSGSRISTESDQPASLTSINMENIGSLVEFLARNKITSDGQRIAYSLDEKISNPNYPLYKLQGSAGALELADRSEAVQYGYYINKDLLVKYLDSLRGQLAKNPNPVMQAQVGALIHQANDQLDTNISGKYQENKQLSPTQIIDRLPQTIQSSRPYSDGNIPLTYGDISADTAFNAWIQKNNISVDGKAYRHPQYDKCGLLKVLDYRSSNSVNNATSAESKEMYVSYKQQVGKLAGDIQCSLSSSTSSAPGATEQQGGQAGQGGAAGQARVQASMQQVIESLPLQRDQLDFGKIRDFVSVYRDIVTASTDPNRSQQALTSLDQVEQYMQGATRNTNGGSMTNFTMDGLTADDLISWARPPSTGQPTRSSGSAVALADYLEYVVRATYNLIKDFYNSHYTALSDPKADPQMLLKVEQQVGGHSIPFGSSIANSNLNNIASARARLSAPGAR